MQNTRVRNLFSTILGVGAVAGGLVLSSCEDEFTEKDAIQAQQETLTALNRQEDSLGRIGAKINYTVTVVAGGSANTNARTTGEAFAQGAKVTVIQGGSMFSDTTNVGGAATFADLRIGEAVVTVEAADHTTVTYTTSLGGSTYNYQENNVETTIPIFPTTVAGGASEVSGIAWAELNTLNDMPEYATGATVRATISVAQALESYGIEFSTGVGEIKSATYSDFVKTATVGEDGRYTLVIPNGNADGGTGIPHQIEFLPFVAEQTYAEQQGDSLVMVTKEIVFGDGTDTHIDENLPGVYAVIGEPVNNARGFELMTEIIRSPLSKIAQPGLGRFSSIKIDDRGAGYAVGDRFNFSDDETENASYITVDAVDGNGTIVEWSLVTNGATYSAKPSLSQDDNASGSGASFVLDYVPAYGIKVLNSGSGYLEAPKVVVSKQRRMNGTLMQEAENINIKDKTNVIDGQIKANTVDDILYVVGSVSKPTFTIIAPVVEKPVVKLVNVSDKGTIIGVTLESNGNGSGYTSQPTVTFKTIGEGMGSGATAIAELGTEGQISHILMVNPGADYTNKVNGTFGAEATPSLASSGPKKLKPGTVKVNHNFNYGGGSEKE